METNVIFKCQICSDDKQDNRFIKLHKSARQWQRQKPRADLSEAGGGGKDMGGLQKNKRCSVCMLAWFKRAGLWRSKAAPHKGVCRAGAPRRGRWLRKGRVDREWKNKLAERDRAEQKHGDANCEGHYRRPWVRRDSYATSLQHYNSHTHTQSTVHSRPWRASAPNTHFYYLHTSLSPPYWFRLDPLHLNYLIWVWPHSISREMWSLLVLYRCI